MDVKAAEINGTDDSSLPATHFIRQWRKHRRMSADQLAFSAGLSGAFISQLEQGRKRYTQNSLESIAAALGVPPGHLLIDPETSIISASSVWVQALDERFWDAIPEEDRDRVRILLRNVMDDARRHAIQTALYFFALAPPAPR